ncbi:MAG: MtnX-like HAD-IB family phosphatase [Candidatus Omnitrophica bacterium]|nr:MtnX-like HAD-IB family phosphatase [Candidatus Omnitrophota bacterium]
MKNIKPKYKVYFDFDNTITSYDILDEVIKRFAINSEWKIWEKKWAEGKIGSKECLTQQLKSLRASRMDLMAYLHTIKVDPYFKKILIWLKDKRIPYTIVSDSFALLIKTILSNNEIQDVKIICNGLKIVEDRFIPVFPHVHQCRNKCGNCKKSHLLLDHPARHQRIYIGDGRSDICPAENADIVFAKGTLRNHFSKKRKTHIPFDNLGEVYRHLKEAKLE